MAIYQMQRPRTSLQTMKFATYNAAIAFTTKSGLLKPTKPYKRMMIVNGTITPVWCVTLSCTVNTARAEYKKAA